MDIAEYLKIDKYILENVKLKNRDRSKGKQERKYKKNSDGFFFLLTRLVLVVQALLILVKKKATKKWLQLHRK